MRNLFANVCLVLVSCAAGLSLCELSLRLFYPKYRYLAEAQFRHDAMRIWARTPNSRSSRSHPDLLEMHSAHSNNLALRQHRNFSAADLAAATNIGFFGDSFTENILMPVQYSFTEPLDYLLNRRGERFNVLNFGVGGYGPGQSFLHYRHFRYAADLDHVFYVYNENDLQNIYETGLFHLDETGHLERNAAIRSSRWAPLVRKLHTAYLVLDASGRLSSFLAETESTAAELKRGQAERWKDERSEGLRRAIRQGRLDGDDLKNSVAIFRQLMRRWKHLVEHNGSTFSVVLLPNDPSPPFVVPLLTAEAVEIIDLDACFGHHDPAHHDREWRNSPYSFRKDGHWNEAGNRLAAVCLYRELEEKTGILVLSESKLQETLFQYYAAFEGRSPEGPRLTLRETSAAIQEKYLALDMDFWKAENEKSELAIRPEKRILSSDLGVHVYLDRNALVYVKEPCRPADMLAPFFVHVFPVDERDLRKRARRRGFERMQFTFVERDFSGLGDHGCVARRTLPAYPVSYIRTGQYVPDAGRLWEGGAWIAPNNSGEEPPESSVAAGRPVIHSEFDVYLDGRQLVYHKAACRPADREAPFFLHATPVDETDPPRDGEYRRFDDLDSDACTTERRLPAYAIRHIVTGQYLPGGGRLWEAELTLDPAGGSGGGNDETPAAQRVVRSVFDVTLDGRRLIYRKAACRPADLQAPFFLHVTPVDETHLFPERTQYGFDNLDFQHRPGFSRVDEFGCTTTRRLPAYAIRHIRTGQFVKDTQGDHSVLWEGEFSVDHSAEGEERRH